MSDAQTNTFAEGIYPKTEVAPQLPPADELAAIRADLKRLEERECQLRALILKEPSARTGNHWVAEVREVESQRTDLKALREMYPAIADEHTYPTVTKRIVLSGIDQDTGEIVNARKMKEQAA